MVTSAFLFEDTFPDDIPFNKIVTVSATLYLFFFGNYLMNYMSSDLVVYEKPDIIASYADIIRRNAEGRTVRVILAPGLPETEIFSQAPEGSIMNQIWKLSKPVDLKQNSLQLLEEFKHDVMNQGAITILREVLVRAVAARAFYLGAELSDGIEAIFAIDDSARETTYSSVIPIGKHVDPFIKDILLRG